MDFGEKLKKLRTEKNMTQSQVADLIGVSRRAYISYEQGNSRPRKRETYDKLANVFNCDVNYLLVDDTSSTSSGLFLIGAGLGIIGATAPLLATAIGAGLGLGFLSARHNKKLEETYSQSLALPNSDNIVSQLEQYQKRQKHFAKTALGLLFEAVASKGYLCRMGNVYELDTLGGQPDDYIILSDNYIENWWLIYFSYDEVIENQIDISPEYRASILLSRFASSRSDKHRMASIIVDDLSLYEAICKYKDHNSYRGNMSVILIDTDDVSITKEEIISTFSSDETNSYGIISII